MPRCPARCPDAQQDAQMSDKMPRCPTRCPDAVDSCKIASCVLNCPVVAKPVCTTNHVLKETIVDSCTTYKCELNCPALPAKPACSGKLTAALVTVNSCQTYQCKCTGPTRGPAGWQSNVGGRVWYRFYPTSMSWHQANNYCRSQQPGASLAATKNFQELAACQRINRSPKHTWIGDIAPNAAKQYRWVGDNTPSVPTFWAWNEPSVHNELCMGMFSNAHYGGRWFDWLCHIPNPFICEFRC